MDDQVAKVRGLLHEVAETHHVVYRITDGADDDWATFYADWLTRLSELPELLGRPPVRSELTYHLVGLDKEYTEAGSAQPGSSTTPSGWSRSSPDSRATTGPRHGTVAPLSSTGVRDGAPRRRRYGRRDEPGPDSLTVAGGPRRWWQSRSWW